MNAPIPRGMEKPPPLATYDGVDDPIDHIDGFEAMLQYLNVGGPIKCRLFPTTLRKTVMDWYKSLPPGSIHSWRELKAQFTSTFTASRRHPKTEASLEAIIQKSEESLREYIDRFNREAIQVPCEDQMKRYLLERGLLPGTDFRKAVGIEPPATFTASRRHPKTEASLEAIIQKSEESL